MEVPILRLRCCLLLVLHLAVRLHLQSSSAQSRSTQTTRALYGFLWSLLANKNSQRSKNCDRTSRLRGFVRVPSKRQTGFVEAGEPCCFPGKTVRGSPQPPTTVFQLACSLASCARAAAATGSPWPLSLRESRTKLVLGQRDHVTLATSALCGCPPRT
ncbi:hypothetical protein PF005_g11265 [Phytophthora fragariae]|uniref:Secreted protein n=1 Tax=Phytophthora fragariae TaxID=53985 RepID=A0A6A3Z9G3_9STRA|nr:hypothetical protein PF003_g35340 [Phytophthora fragariae]KAE8937649.1 hypothetical protein PF009_g12456 [Phytophthora fragariae]KAE9009458.1 hypothetical protein PF011_g10264 [Phytophthora fragariae]KAE9111527.1 hypothetical protein PF007_g11451 [Phytophthora fragariae]KAE9111614.1 hypothetical protein PF010_g10746 [Phytophthora fragariae]